MADLVTSILAGAATVTVMAIREAISWGVSRGRTAQVPPPSTTMLPPPPQPSHPSLSGACEHDGEIDSLRRDHEALKGEVRAEAARATDFRERVLERLARIGERLKITQERGHGDRGST